MWTVYNDVALYNDVARYPLPVACDRGLSVLGSFPEARDRQLGIGSNLGMLGAVWMDIIVCWE